MSGGRTEPPAVRATWSDAAGRRAGALLLSLLCGIAVPLSPPGAEYFVTGEILAISWFAVAVTYVAGVGLVSRSLTILVCSLVAASYLAFVYGVDLQKAFDAATAVPPAPVHRLDPGAAKVAIAVASALYLAERVSRHLFDGKPFLET